MNQLVAFLKSPIPWAILAALGGTNSAVQFTGRGDDYKAGFDLCRELALENRDAGLRKIIPLLPENIVEAVEKE